MSTDRIEKRVELRAPVERVWRALTDHREFAAWFGLALEGPFVAGQVTSGRVTVKGYEHVRFDVRVVAMEKPGLFAYEWHPHAVDAKADYSKEPPTRVEFTLAKTATGTLLTVVESGFDALPASRRAEAFRANEGGWTWQMKNVEAYVGRNP